MKIKVLILAMSISFLYSCSTTKSSGHTWLTNLESGLKYAKKEKKSLFGV